MQIVRPVLVDVAAGGDGGASLGGEGTGDWLFDADAGGEAAAAGGGGFGGEGLAAGREDFGGEGFVAFAFAAWGVSTSVYNRRDKKRAQREEKEKRAQPRGGSRAKPGVKEKNGRSEESKARSKHEPSAMILLKSAADCDFDFSLVLAIVVDVGVKDVCWCWFVGYSLGCCAEDVARRADKIRGECRSKW